MLPGVLLLTLVPSARCAANIGFVATATGGDGSDEQYCASIPPQLTINGSDALPGYVGYSPELESIIAAHQGTNPSSMYENVIHSIPSSIAELFVLLYRFADLTDSDIVLMTPSGMLFPGLPSSIEVHIGFASDHAKSATAILAAVQKALAMHSASSVTLVGHSLGAVDGLR